MVEGCLKGLGGSHPDIRHVAIGVGIYMGMENEMEAAEIFKVQELRLTVQGAQNNCVLPEGFLGG